MLRKSSTCLALLGAVTLLALGAAAPAHAASGGLCQLQGTASFTPGLNNTAQNFSYSFSGSLSGCQSTDQTSPASGTVSAGQVVTGAGGEQFQEPVATGNGTCANGTTSGVAIASWADGTQTVVSYGTTAAAAAVKLTGFVVSSVTLAAINPQPGQPTSETITTTRYAGDQAQGHLAFQADPTQCSGSGLTSAGISGSIGLGSTS